MIAAATAIREEEILIVDDTPANLRLLTQMLAGQGYHVRAVTNGARALESAQARPPSLILLDIRMPEMDGYEVCQTLKADETTRDIPVIFISALDEIQDKVRAFKAGGVDYITKPFQLEEVLVRTETHLALRKLQRQLQDANRKFERELALAGQIQDSFLPRELPDVPGWQLSAVLLPARETSGDFYDVIPLPGGGGQLGILVADVADKGAGAALYMALSWSLIRTYAATHPAAPARVFAEVNRRLVTDTDASQFVTLFYGVLDPATGELAYCNAGQCPPLLLRSTGVAWDFLTQTGPPLGAFEDQAWGPRTAQMAAGDLLVLYTDGISEAEDGSGGLFGMDRLLECTRAGLAASRAAGGESLARDVLDRILSGVAAFAGEGNQDDDTALVVVARLHAPV
jgi:sigma-B regulation protein RsbU (phosphoserine phosphatase)